MKIKKLVLLIQLLFLVTLSASAQKKVQTKESLPPLIPMKDFFKNPERTGYSLSPNGEYLAFLQPWEKRLNDSVLKKSWCVPQRSDRCRPLRGLNY